jgi:hypothetical protein
MKRNMGYRDFEFPVEVVFVAAAFFSVAIRSAATCLDRSTAARTATPFLYWKIERQQRRHHGHQKQHRAEFVAGHGNLLPSPRSQCSRAYIATAQVRET